VIKVNDASVAAKGQRKDRASVAISRLRTLTTVASDATVVTLPPAKPETGPGQVAAQENAGTKKAAVAK
jgi:hypothetical protein